MSTKPPSRRTPEPPNLRSDLAGRSDVKELLAELQDGLKEGEDPLFYKLRRAAPDPACVGADAARIYVAPRAVSGVARPVVETAKVSVRGGVDARRAVRGQGALRRVRGAWIVAVVLGLLSGGVVVLVLRSAPERSSAETASPVSAPRVSAAATVPSASVSATAVPSVRPPSSAVSASVSAAPKESAAPVPLSAISASVGSAKAASATAAPTRKPGRRGVEIPYDAAPPASARTAVIPAPVPATTIPPELLN